MREIIDKINSVSTETDHYLVKAMTAKQNYLAEFLEVAHELKGLLTVREFELWCTEKMLLKQQPFAEKKFIQYAVETSVVSYFGNKFPVNFRVEAKINPENEKDVDCQFTDNGFKYNVEVKCSDFVSKEKIESEDTVKFSTAGRLPDRGAEAIRIISEALNEGFTKKGEPLKQHVVCKNMDNNLKIFLELAHEKFSSIPKENEVNVLVVGCDDERDIQNWVNYLWAGEGLFTQQSFADKTKFKNVDLVVLTNQYFKHNKYFDKSAQDCWTLDNGFNLIFRNPTRRMKKENGIKHFMSILPNYTEELGNYIVPGSAPDYVKDTIRISWFVKDNLEKQQNKYVFERKTSQND